MLVAVIAAIATLVVAAAVIAAVLVVRARTKSPHAAAKQDVRSIDSVGVASSLSPSARREASSAVKVPSGPQGSANPADGLKSRFAAMGVLAAAIFGSLTAKLWSMQVLSSSQFFNEAEQNKYTIVKTPAPRGVIYDANGLALVRNRSSLTVLADAEAADDRDVLLRLSAVLGVPYNVVRQRIQDATAGAQSQRVVVSDARMRDVAFISEHADAFPHVTVQTRTVRDYPYGALAAHALGYTGPVGEEDLASVREGREVESGDDVGKSGVEAVYDDLLAGDHGERRVVADATGNVVEVAGETQPTRGSDVYLTIKGPVQYVCDRALASLVAPEDGAIGSGTGVAGAVVVMDVRDGGIVAMSSFPTFDPSRFIGGIPADVWDVYQNEDSYYPMLNRVLNGSYPAASTYKAFTAMAALACGIADEGTTWGCGGTWDGFGSGLWQDCWQKAGHGTLDLRGGIVNSCDVVFYEIAKSFWQAGKSQGGSLSDTALQEYLERFRFDQETGIDLGGESVGRIPTPQWKAEYYRNRPEEGQWQGGDMTNMIIGQGYVLVTPMEMAVAYGAIATGNIMRPHLLKEVRTADGGVAVAYEPEVVSSPEMNAAHLTLVRDALRGVATDNADTAAVFNRFGIDPSTVACKTGTAEVAGKDDYAWCACYAPFDDPKYVVACVVEEGGGGSAVGVPLGAEVMAAALRYDAGELEEMGVVAGSTGKLVERRHAATSGRTD